MFLPMEKADTRTLKYKTIKSGTINTTNATQLGVLKTAYNNLTTGEKYRSIIVYGTSGYQFHPTHIGNGVFTTITTTGREMILLDSTKYYSISNNGTSTDKSAETPGSTYNLMVLVYE